MRKIFVTMASMVLALVMCFSALTGCGLITTDTERDMKQKVATIQIGNAKEEVIYKRDMIMAYLNYGYMYEQYYGYTREQTFTLIIDSLVNNRIFVQAAINAQYEEDKGWDVEKYLTTEQALEAKYSTYKSINDLIDSYKTQPQADKADTAWVTARAVPTNATNKETEVDKNAYVANIDTNGFDKDSTPEVRNAYNKVIELLRVNELLGSDYKGDIRDSIYFTQTLLNYQESELIEAVEANIKNGVRTNAKYSFEKLNDEYVSKRTAQSEMNITDFVSKLSSATASDPLLIGKDGGYGYVYNLLIGADDVLTSKISSIKTDLEKDNITKDEYAIARRNILSATTITDQRSSWITSGYDFDGTKFTGDYAFLDDSLPFKGTATKIKDATEDASAKYRVDGLTEFNLLTGDKNFIDMMEKYVYGATQSGVVDANPSVFKKVESSAVIVDYEKRINELLFAFSTDPGSLNTYKGYVIKPVPEGSNTEEYMQEFADAARELITMGGSSYIMVATDYGYHIMFYSELLKADYGFATLTAYLNDLYGKTEDDAYWAAEYAKLLADWDDTEDTEHYLYILANSMFSTEMSNAVTEYQRNTLNTYRYDENSTAVKIFADIYADLMA